MRERRKGADSVMREVVHSFGKSKAGVPTSPKISPVSGWRFSLPAGICCGCYRAVGDGMGVAFRAYGGGIKRAHAGCFQGPRCEHQRFKR